VITHPDLLVGIEYSDDAAIYRLSESEALVQTVDFFTPIVDDAFDWGRIAATNALADVYAMGGRPITAMHVVGWPRDELPLELLSEVQRGGASVLLDAGCVLVGGHSIDNPEPLYGMAVTGLVDPSRMITNAGARPGDAIVLTKPIGTGLVATAIKRQLATEEQVAAAIAVMTELIRDAVDAGIAVGARSGTDVTGYGLIGHLAEVASASGVGARIDHRQVPELPGARRLAEEGVLAGGSRRNLQAAEATVDFGNVEQADRILLCDAQTSGGLLLAIPQDRVDDLVSALGEAGASAAAVIGEFTEGPGISVR
jgi:selenide,water dikinase